MKKYDAMIIIRYVQLFRESIDRIDVGIMEDWIATNQRIYANDDLLIEIPRKNDLTIRGLKGSLWGTPVMRVVLKDGTVRVVRCYHDDYKSLSKAKVHDILMDYMNRGVKKLGWDGVLR